MKFKQFINKVDLLATAYGEDGEPCEICQSIRFWTMLAFAMCSAANVIALMVILSRV